MGELVTDKKSKYRSIQSILKDPQKKSKLSNLVDEAVEMKLKIQHHQLGIKAAREAAVSELEIDPKVFNYYVSMVFNNDYAARKESVDQLSDLIDSVMLLAGPASYADDSED